MLRQGTAKPLAEYIDDSSNVRETLKAVRDCYCAELDTENALAAALEAEENGEVCNLKILCSAVLRAERTVLAERLPSPDVHMSYRIESCEHPGC